MKLIQVAKSTTHMGVGRFFSRGREIVDFFRGRSKVISKGVNNGEISFCQVETKNTTFLLKV